MGTILRRALLSWAVVCMACGGDSTAPADIVVTGIWQLRTVGGTPPPVVINQTSTTKTELTSDAYSLNADGTYSELTGARVTQGVTVTTTTLAYIGVYQNTNGAVRFTQTSPSSGSYSGTVNGNTLTIISGSNTFVYQR